MEKGWWISTALLVIAILLCIVYYLGYPAVHPAITFATGLGFGISGYKNWIKIEDKCKNLFKITSDAGLRSS